MGLDIQLRPTSPLGSQKAGQKTIIVHQSELVFEMLRDIVRVLDAVTTGWWPTNFG